MEPLVCTLGSAPSQACIQRRPSRGFTLLEMLVVLAISSVLLGLAAPAFRSVGDSIKLRTATNDFVAFLQTARSEAIKRNSRVVLCKSADGRTCAATGGWEQGLIVFHDANNNGDADAGETVILRRAALPSALKLTGNLNVARYVSFAPSGVSVRARHP